MSAFECTKEAIMSAANACEYAKMACGDQYKYLDFIDFYYCDLDQNVPVIVILSILFVLFIFNLLGTTADRYLAPALEVLSEKLNISEAVAGVTLVALANGATDVVAGIVAGGKEAGGFTIAIGALFGACLFTVTCVLARCIQGGGIIQTDPSSLGRDIFFLLLATGYFIFLTIINVITPVLASGFFMIYVAYFGFVIYQQKRKPEPKEPVKERLLSIKLDYLKAARSKTAGDDPIDNLLSSHIMKRSLKLMISRGKSAELVGFSKDHKKTGADDAQNEQVRDLSKLELDIQSFLEEEEESNTCLDKILRVYNAPFFFIRDLTMPPFEEERWNVFMACVTPLFGLLFLIWQFDMFKYFIQHWYLWLVYAAIAVPLSLWILIAGWKRNLAKEHSGVFSAISFIISAVWLSFIANCFMDFLSLITVISGLPLNYLSLTMLAWGNSLDDFFIDYVICKSGHGQMAVTGVYAGQLFNLLIGFGAAMFRQSLMATITPNIYDFSGDFGSTVFTTNLLTVILLGSLITCLLLTLLIAKLNKWAIGKKALIFVLSFYLAFFVTVSALALA